MQKIVLIMVNTLETDSLYHETRQHIVYDI